MRIPKRTAPVPPVKPKVESFAELPSDLRELDDGRFRTCGLELTDELRSFFPELRHDRRRKRVGSAPGHEVDRSIQPPVREIASGSNFKAVFG